MAAWTNATPVCGAPNATALRHMDARLADYGCERYVFEGPHTVIAEWSLVCERFHLLSVVEMCFLAGAGVGSMCSGWLSDKFGRRHTLMGFVVAQSVLGKCFCWAGPGRFWSIIGSGPIRSRYNGIITLDSIVLNSTTRAIEWKDSPVH